MEAGRQHATDGRREAGAAEVSKTLAAIKRQMDRPGNRYPSLWQTPVGRSVQADPDQDGDTAENPVAAALKAADSPVLSHSDPICFSIDEQQSTFGDT